VLDTLMAIWRSETLPWIVLGSIVAWMAVVRMSETPARQNAYGSREACERDYRPDQCSRGSGGSGYYGPRFSSGTSTADDPGPGRTAAADGRSQAASGVHNVSRGGFGSTGRGHGGGGYG
jgi:hypothetical protein